MVMRAFLATTIRPGLLHRTWRSCRQVSALRSVFTWVLVLAVSCSEVAPTDVGWSVHFVCAELGQRAEQVRVGIAPGTCPSATQPVYEATIYRAAGPDVEAPATLTPGPYAFYARAFDEKGTELAQGCLEVTLPRAESVVIDLDSNVECKEGPAGGKPDPDTDGGAVDSGPRLEATQSSYAPLQPITVRFFDVTKPGKPMIRLFDAAADKTLVSISVPFEGKKQIASGMAELQGQPSGVYEAQLVYDSGIASSVTVTVLADRDADGTPDASDGCADDALKTAPGLCGCGTPDTNTDGDAVVDCMDGCPSDNLKSEPLVCGCGFLESFEDQDGDGLSDCYDACPTDPAKQRPLLCGCGVVETDTDGDTAPDCQDECPTNPAKTLRGACGCDRAETDADGDGTADCVDACPADPAKIAVGTCGCGAREPFDVASFRDAMGENCGDWKGYDCTQAVERWKYTQAQEAAVLENCSRTCGVCPAAGP